MSQLYEIESKRWLRVPQDEFEKLLADNGYAKVSEETEQDIYYSRNDVDYMKTVECLRIRKKSDFAEITYKPASSEDTKVGSGVTIKPETDVHLAGPQEVESAITLFDSIGLIKLVAVKKHRKTFKNATDPYISIAIDEVEDGGTFLEVEVMSSNIDNGHEQMIAIEKQFNIDSMELAMLPYRDIVMTNKHK